MSFKDTYVPIVVPPKNECVECKTKIKGSDVDVQIGERSFVHINCWDQAKHRR